MALPKNTVKPNYNHTYPSERQYYDETTSVLDTEVVADAMKSGADYGIIDQQVAESIAGTESETGNGGGTP